MKKQDYIFGIRPVLEAIKEGKELEKVLIKKGLNGDLYHNLLNSLRSFQVPFQFVPQEKLDRITRNNHQGVIAFLSSIEYVDIEMLVPGLFDKGKMPFLLILDRITDVRNMGAIARTAECAGVDAILVPAKESAQINADAIKTSAGALLKIPVCRCHKLSFAVDYLKKSGIKIFAATEKASNLIYNSDFKGPVAIIVGSEENGISVDLMKMADELVKIPLSGDIESLNVSVATAIVTFEAVRQRI